MLLLGLPFIGQEFCRRQIKNLPSCNAPFAIGKISVFPLANFQFSMQPIHSCVFTGLERSDKPNDKSNAS